MEHKCNEKDCKEPIWQNNPLVYVLCDHPKCRKCVQNIFLGEEWTTVNCDSCGKQEDTKINYILKSVDACISASNITEAPKEKIKDTKFNCSSHIKQEIIFFCHLCNLYGCFECMDNHIDHKFGNVVQVKKDEVIK